MWRLSIARGYSYQKGAVENTDDSKIVVVYSGQGEARYVRGCLLQCKVQNLAIQVTVFISDMKDEARKHTATAIILYTLYRSLCLYQVYNDEVLNSSIVFERCRSHRDYFCILHMSW